MKNTEKTLIERTVGKIMLATLGLLFVSSALAEKAALFVSLGMPDNTLKLYLKQADQYHIPIVIRGLYTNKEHKAAQPYVGSFQDTVSRVKALVGSDKVGGVSIDPILFRAFGVTVVPALVVYNEGNVCIKWANQAKGPTCSENDFDVAFGNLPIHTLLRRISRDFDEGHRADYANLLINKYGSDPYGS